jgi:hypothetical protein
MASKDKVATKQEKSEHHDRKQDHHHFKKNGGSDLTNPQHFRKINPPELPVIGINSGGNISHAKTALITYCEKELGPISNMFTDMVYQDKIIVSYDAEALSEKNGPLGLNKACILAKMKQADIDNHAYEKSKTKLHGIITSMTIKELSVRRSTLEPVRPTSVASTMATTTSRFSTSADTNTAFLNCPLSL